MSSAKRTSQGTRGERRRALARFFSSPEGVAQRRYEALRAYFVEGASAAQAAKRFGYAPATMVALVRDFRPEAGEFFIERRPGPRVAPAKHAARERVLALRAQGHSVTEIAATLQGSPTPLNRTGVGSSYGRRGSSAWRRARPQSAVWRCATTRRGCASCAGPSDRSESAPRMPG